MRSAVIEQDHDALIALNRALSPEERLLAFYNHSFLVTGFSAIQRTPEQSEGGVLTVHPEARAA